LIRSTVGFSNPGTGGTGNGAQGTTGAQGAQGVQGAVGSQGATGVQGTTGTQGTTGSQGTTGTGTQGTQGTIGANGAGGTIGYYGSFYSNADQTLNAINTEQPITFSSTYPNGANGISIIDGSKITIANPGTYTMTATIQVANSDNAVQSAEFWLKLNGQIYPSSTTNATLAPRKNSEQPSHDLMTINFVGTSTAPNDYVQIFWKGTHQGVYLDRIASNDIPESPSIVLAISQVSYQGIQGVQGSTGAQGSTGPQGTVGTQGTVGIQGIQGTIGTSASDLNAWTAYNPTWTSDSGTPGINNGTLTGRYKQIGKTVFFNLKLTYGSTTTGGSGAWMFGLPVTAYDANYQFAASILNNGLAWYGAIGNGNYKNSTSYFTLIHQNDTSTTVWGGVTASAPFIFGAGDTLTVSGSYESE
jgi:hypothetical protein